MKNIGSSILLLCILSVLTGIIYPLFITVAAQVFFPLQANGSILSMNGKIIGSQLLGQNFSDGRYFHSRPSATNYNTLPSGGSNLTQISKALRDSVSTRSNRFTAFNSSDPSKIPVDMICASASGLDPHISPAAAFQQIERICRYRKFDTIECAQLHKLVIEKTERPQMLFLGDNRVNVLLLNIALDSLRVYK